MPPSAACVASQITPHSAFLTDNALSNIAQTTLDNILAFTAGKARAPPLMPCSARVLPLLCFVCPFLSWLSRLALACSPLSQAAESVTQSRCGDMAIRC